MIDEIDLQNHPPAEVGSGFYRTLIVVEVLTDRPVDNDGVDLRHIASEIIEGGAYGRVGVIDSREVSRATMVKLLRQHGTDPEFLLWDDAWKYGLHPGDEVIWNDPNDASLHLTLRISSIEWSGEIAKITDTGAKYFEVHAKDLS